MKSIKISMMRKISIYILCICIITASIFTSYDNTLLVHAEMPPAYYATESVIGIAAAIVGILGTPVTGGSSLALLAPSVFAVIDGADNLHDYFVDNGDDTFTLTPAFIQLVLDEQKRQEESYFHDFKSIQNYDGSYNISGYALYWGLASGKESIHHYILSGTSVNRPFAVIVDMHFYIRQYYNGDHSILNVRYENYVESNGKTYTGMQAGYDCDLGYGLNIPVFASFEAALDAFESGNFRGALNYREPLFQYGSIYAPVYTGGSVRISKSVLDGFEDELKEVNDKYDDVDDKINALYEYIFNGGNSGGGTGGGFDFNFDFPFDIDSPLDLGNWFNDLFDNPFEFGDTFITSLADFFKDLADGLKKKFPFSIPWDVYHIFTVFSNVDSPEPAGISTLSFGEENSGIQIYTIDPEDIAQDAHDAPYFKLPIYIKSFGIYEEIIVDMKDFKTLSTFSRTMFSLLFAVFLLKFTLKILSIFGVFGGGDD